MGRTVNVRNRVKAWPPDWLPDSLLPPDREPEISMDELLDRTPEEYAVLYYRRSGRFLGEYPDRETAEAADKYRFVRALLPGGELPWEKEVKNEQAS